MRKRDLGILILCAFAILWSFRGEQGGYYFSESWVIPIDTTLYSNLHFPTLGEKLPKPLITDLDGDDQNEIVYTSRDCTIKIVEVSHSLGAKSAPVTKAQSTLLQTVGVRTGRRPVGLASGYLESTGKGQKQVIVVVTEGWIVMCFDHNLELLWESTPVDEVPEGSYHEEISILISPHPVRVGDKGIVVVGGRLASPGLENEGIQHEHETTDVGPDKKLEREEEGHHFSYYAYDGKTGALRWKHEEGDFFSKESHEEDEPEDVETFMPSHSFKQHVFSQSRHLGEVDWRNYRQYVMDHLPYRWVDGFDTRFTLDKFEKKSNFGRNPAASKPSDGWNTDAIGIPNPLGTSELLATNQISPKKDVENPNVIVATVKSGLEIIHLYTGRPLCRLLLPSLQATRSAGSYADVNFDGVIDEVVASIDSTAASPHNSFGIGTNSKSARCLAVATSGLPPLEQLWNGSICRSGSFDMAVRLGATSRSLTTVAPSFLPSSTTLGLNTIFMVSSGRVTSYDPNGNRLWYVESTANWRKHDYPVLTPIHISPKDPSLHIIAIGTSLSLISSGGQLLSSIRLRKTDSHETQDATDSGIQGGPKHGEIWSVAPPTLGDYNHDGLADVIIVAHDGLYAYSIAVGVGSVLFPGLVVALILVMLFALVQSEGGLGGKSNSSGGKRSVGPRKRALD